MVTSFWNVCDLLAFLPPLIEAACFVFSWTPLAILGRVDLRILKLLRSMRVMRIGLLGNELRSLHLSTKSGGWLSRGANFRLFQLATSVLILLFMTTSLVRGGERESSIIPTQRAGKRSSPPRGDDVLKGAWGDSRCRESAPERHTGRRGGIAGTVPGSVAPAEA